MTDAAPPADDNAAPGKAGSKKAKPAKVTPAKAEPVNAEPVPVVAPVEIAAVDKRCGFVAILGETNAGKSTLVPDDYNKPDFDFSSQVKLPI